ncbi:hypothetical protein HMPREF9124_1659 [Oribacterium sp. oral taxon 108 str. F0425]|nr:hypothetical protein HMPREF9124_1659 [Oribacterium sp. oral taxon 108 str. F0425]
MLKYENSFHFINKKSRRNSYICYSTGLGKEGRRWRKYG